MARLIDVALTHPYLAFGAEVIALIAMGGLLNITIGAIGRRLHRIPAAPDNQPGTNPADLWTCRRIEALPTVPRKESQP